MPRRVPRPAKDQATRDTNPVDLPDRSRDQASVIDESCYAHIADHLARNILDKGVASFPELEQLDFAPLLESMHRLHVEDMGREVVLDTPRSGSLNSELLVSAPHSLFVLDRNACVLEINDSARELLAYGPALGSLPLAECVREEGLAEFYRHLRGSFKSKQVFEIELPMKTYDGHEFVGRLATRALGENFDRAITSIVDVTESKSIEDRLHLRNLCFEATTSGIAILDACAPGLPIISVNPAFLEINDFPSEQCLGWSLDFLRGSCTDHETWGRLELALARGDSCQVTVRLTRRDGDSFWSELSVSPIINNLAKLTHFVCVQTDISDRMLAEQALRQSEARYRAISELTTNLAYACGLDTDGRMRFEWLVGQYEDMTGYQLSEFVTLNYWLPMIPETELEAAKTRLEKLRTGEADVSEFAIVTKSGELRWIRDYARPIRNPHSGLIDRVYGAAQDVTHHWLAEKEHQVLEEQLRQSQKMEAVGRLAGGVAHDFNNLLTTIIGNTSLLAEDLEDNGSDCGILVDEIFQAASRASDLTRQLLAFSRKQILKAERIDANIIIRESIQILRRLIREDVKLEFRLASSSCPILADSGQISQILLNLCVNAQDAMPLGGELLVCSERQVLEVERIHDPAIVPAGEYVVISVLDTGEGMDEETISHIFEPFFTTKEVGKGTGLGLATVYGAVHQTGGFVGVKSEIGKGTRFDVYLPLDEGALTDVSADLLPIAKNKRGQERIFVVEDERGVRRLLRQALESAGYQVFTACNGLEALELFLAEEQPIDLLLTDVIMPEMGGKELADRLCVEFKELRVLFISGYTYDAIARHGIIDQDLNFLQKPFMPSVLIEKVREVLDRAPRFVHGPSVEP